MHTLTMRLKCSLGVFLLFALVACGGGGGGSSAPTVTAPAAPSNVHAAAGDAQITVTWGQVFGATGYRVYMAEVTGVTQGNYSTLTGGVAYTNNVTSPFVISGLLNGQAYFIAMTAVNSAGESVDSSEVSATPALVVSASLWDSMVWGTDKWE